MSQADVLTLLPAIPGTTAVLSGFEAENEKYPRIKYMEILIDLFIVACGVWYFLHISGAKINYKEPKG